MLVMFEKDILGGVVEEKEVLVGKFDSKSYMFLELLCYRYIEFSILIKKLVIY